MRVFLVTGVIFALTIAVHGGSPDAFNAIQRLQEDLFNGYNAHVIPVRSPSDSLPISAGLTLLDFNLNEMSSRLDASCWVMLSWNDVRLNWNPQDYEGEKFLHLKPDTVWKPDFTLYNNMESTSEFALTNVLVQNDGLVRWIVPADLTARCETNLITWPFDSHDCKLKFGSWTMSSKSLSLSLMNNQTEINFVDSEDVGKVGAPNWRIIGTSAVVNSKIYSCCEEAYEDVTFSVSFERRSSRLFNPAVIPAVVMVCLSLLSLWIPPTASEKVLVIVINLLFITGYIIYLFSVLPTSAEALPSIISFCAWTILLEVVSLVFAVMGVRMTKLPLPRDIPTCLKGAISSSFASMLCLGQVSGKHVNVEERADQDWLLLSVFIDRILYIIYCILFTVLVVLFLC